MKSHPFSQMKPISSLPQNYSELAESTKETGDIVFLKRNMPFVVLMDFERWQKLTELEEKMNEIEAFEAIKESEREFKAGKAKVLTSLADLQ